MKDNAKNEGQGFQDEMAQRWDKGCGAETTRKKQHRVEESGEKLLKNENL